MGMLWLREKLGSMGSCGFLVMFFINLLGIVVSLVFLSFWILCMCFILMGDGVVIV